MKRSKLGKIMGETFVKEDFERYAEESASDDDISTKEGRDKKLESGGLGVTGYWFLEGYFDEAE